MEFPSPSAVLVFGSNLAGRHGRGCAAFARRWCGAEYGVGEGPTGGAYALPTKDAHLRTLPVDRIAQSVTRFLNYADTHPTARFEITRVGCGLAGYCDDAIAPLFRDAPSNCLLPYTWQRQFHPGLPLRIIVAGSRTFNNYPKLTAMVDIWTSRLPQFEILSGGARGADALGERYAQAHGIRRIRIPAEWRRYGKSAGMIRNQRMSFLASHLIAAWDGASPGTRHMIETARSDGLAVRVLQYSDQEDS